MEERQVSLRQRQAIPGVSREALSAMARRHSRYLASRCCGRTACRCAIICLARHPNLTSDANHRVRLGSVARFCPSQHTSDSCTSQPSHAVRGQPIDVQTPPPSHAGALKPLSHCEIAPDPEPPDPPQLEQIATHFRVMTYTESVARQWIGTTDQTILNAYRRPPSKDKQQWH